MIISRYYRTSQIERFIFLKDQPSILHLFNELRLKTSFTFDLVKECEWQLKTMCLSPVTKNIHDLFISL